MDEQGREKAAASLLNDMEDTAARMRELIVGMPAHDLIGYIYAQRLMSVLTDRGSDPSDAEPRSSEDVINDNQFLLEYVHAVLASDMEPAAAAFDEGKCAELYELSRHLREQAMLYAMATSAGTKDGVFGRILPTSSSARNPVG